MDYEVEPCRYTVFALNDGIRDYRYSIGSIKKENNSDGTWIAESSTSGSRGGFSSHIIASWWLEKLHDVEMARRAEVLKIEGIRIKENQ